jgi:hypothetical protein
MIMKLTYALGAAALIILIMGSSVAYASLDVAVSVEYPQIIPIQNQIITATANERGQGVLLVLQPAEGMPWEDFLVSHPNFLIFWNMLPDDIKVEVCDKIGGKIVTFNVVSFGLGGGSKAVSFPDDFTGINGAPSTELSGEYKVIFAYLSYERDESDSRCCCIFEIGFDCIGWNVHVVPEIPFGTIATIFTMILAMPVYRLYRKPHQQ